MRKEKKWWKKRLTAAFTKQDMFANENEVFWINHPIGIVDWLPPLHMTSHRRAGRSFTRT